MKNNDYGFSSENDQVTLVSRQDIPQASLRKVLSSPMISLPGYSVTGDLTRPPCHRGAADWDETVISH